MTNGKYLKAQQVAELLNVKRGTLANWRWERRGPPYCKIGRCVRYREGDVLRFAEQYRVDPTKRPKK